MGHMSRFWDTRATLCPMNLATPSSIAIPETTGRVLKVLAGTTRPLSGREVARLSASPRTTVSRILRDLELQGLAKVQEAGAGAALLYTLNRDHLAAEPVLTLMNLKQRLIVFLTHKIECWSIQPHHASLFGSAARGDGDSASDIDLFIVRPDGVAEHDHTWRSQLDRLARTVKDATGNRAGISEISELQLRQFVYERPPIIDELEGDAITLVGPGMRSLTRRVPA